MSLESLKYLQDYNSRYSGTQENQALVNVLLGRAQEERNRQAEANKMLQAIQLQSQLQQEHLSGLNKNEMAKLAQQEKIKKEELAARDEKMKPVFEDRARLAEELNAATAEFQAAKVQQASETAAAALQKDTTARKYLADYREAGGDKTIDLINLLQMKSSDPKAATLLADYNGMVKGYLADPKFIGDAKHDARIADLQNRIRDASLAIEHHMYAGGSWFPTYGTKPYVPPVVPAKNPLPITTETKPPPTAVRTPDTIQGALPAVSNAVSGGISDFNLRYGRPIGGVLNNIWSHIFGGNPVSTDQLYSPEEKAMLLNQQLRDTNVQKEPLIQNMPGLPGPYLPTPPELLSPYAYPSRTAPFNPQPVIVGTPPELAPNGGYVYPPRVMPDALQPSVVNPAMWGVQR